MRMDRLALLSCAAALLVPPLALAQPREMPVPVVASITLPSAITSLTSLSGSSLVAAGMADGRIAVWNGRDAAPVILAPHAVRVLALGSSADGRVLWSVDKDGSLVRTAIDTANLRAPPPAGASRKLDFGSERVIDAVFSSDAGMIVTGGEHGELRVFDSATGTLRQQIRAHRTELQALAVRPGSSIVASASAEADLRIWDMGRGREISGTDGMLSLFALTFSPDGATLASGGVDRRLTLRQSDTFKETGQLTLSAPRLVAALAWSPDGRAIALADIDDGTLSKGGIEILDAASRRVTWQADTGGVPAGRLVFAGERTVIGAGGPLLRAWTAPASPAVR